MDTRLLFLFLGVHYVCAGQVLLPAPLLIADKEALTEADVVEFHCQTSHYNPECVFSFESSQYEQLPCRTRLSRRVLLSKVKNPSVTDVNVICHYRPKVVQHWSPQSNFLSIAMRDLAPPSLAVVPSVITASETVTLQCRPPASVSVSQCGFSVDISSSSSTCVWTVTGSQLLTEKHSPPARLDIMCFYQVNDKKSYSPYSSRQTVTIITSFPKNRPHETTAGLEPLTTSVTGGDTKQETTDPQSEESTTTMMVFETETGRISKSAVWRLLLLLCVCGVILGGVILVLTLICTNAAHGAKSHHNNRELNLQHLEEETQISHQRLEQDVDSSAPAIRQDADSEAANAQIPNSSESLTSAAYSLITSAPAVEAKADSQVVGKNMVRRQSSVYHFYCTIPDKPPPQTMDYSYV
uniref:Ig-like domain-containing protein n=1 Tax=Knipowitschia caucasica TaxID=637954 RepID=A0AAV2JHY6_KNICA